MQANFRTMLAAIALMVLAGFAGRAEAGALELVNASPYPIACQVDGWTQTFVVPPGKIAVPPNATRPGAPIINSVWCGGLATRMMNITPAGPNGTLLLTGAQTRVLNVALYSFIPNVPGATFEVLVNNVIMAGQMQNPQVLLSVQMNPVAQNTSPTRIYSFTELPAQLQQGGFDVMEVDTLYLGFLAQGGFINPVEITGDTPLPVALQASSFGGQLWGIPSWLCMDFIFSFNPAVRDVNSLPELFQFLGGTPSGQTPMVGDYNGSWRLPSIYINAYVQNYGYGQIARSVTAPPDPATISNIIDVTATCANGAVNNCINGTYHNSPTPGPTEKAFATGQAGADVGFSEQSLYINYYAPGAPPPLYVTPAVWGNQPQPLLFSDAFVTSSANCPPQSPCAADATLFTTLMTSAAMKTFIVESQDVPEGGAPARTLLVATEPFYAQPEIANDPFYRQLTPVFANAQPFPNDFTADIQDRMKHQICQALQSQQPGYDC